MATKRNVYNDKLFKRTKYHALGLIRKCEGRFAQYAIDDLQDALYRNPTWYGGKNEMMLIASDALSDWQALVKAEWYE